MDDDIDYLL